MGPDGLTKKERRALKVQSRPDGEQGVNKSEKITTESTVTKEVKQISVPEKKSEKPQVVNNEKPKNKDNLTEKQLRKLEWDKKFAAQKQESTDKPDGLSKAELKAKRREQQEAQRLAKTTKVVEKPPPPTKEKTPQPQQPKQEPAKVKPTPKPSKSKPNINRVELVQHLYNEPSNKSQSDDQLVNFKNVHPAFIRLGVQYSSKTILGSNARCLALLTALKQLVRDVQPPSKQEFCRYLESVLQECTNYLQRCRPMAVSMSNALRQFNLELTKQDTNLSDNEKRVELIRYIDGYIKDDIVTAGEAIKNTVNEKISNDDIILTYGW